MTDAVLSQQVLEVASTATPDAILSQQAIEVANTTTPPVVVTQVAVETLQTTAPPALVQQVVIEVLSSTTPASFDPSVAFWGMTPAGEVTERWSWLSDIQVARSGAQVRTSLRAEPRVQVEFDILTTTATESALADALVTGWQARSYYLPIWQDRAAIGADLTAGTASISTPTDGLGYSSGGMAAIWAGPADYEVVQLADAADGTLTLAQPLARNWSPGASIAPLRRAWLQAEAGAQRFTGEAMEARLVFDLEEPVATTRIEWEEGAWAADGFALFTRRPNWTDQPQTTYARRMRTFGDGTVRPWRQDASGRGWIRRSELHTATSRAEVNALIAWAAQRRGRARSYLAPIWDASLQVTRPNAYNDASIYVSGRNYEQMLAAIAGRGYIALRDATGWIVRRVLTATAEGSENKLTLAATIGRDGTPTGWLDMVWCEPSHLSSDSIEVRWWSNTVADIAIAHEQVIS